MTCPICGEFALDDDSEAHHLADIEELKSWTPFFKRRA